MSSKKGNSIFIYILICVIILIVLTVVIYQGYCVLRRVRPVSACTSDGTCSVDVVDKTLTRISDRLDSVSQEYAQRHHLQKTDFRLHEGVKSYAEHKHDIYLCLRNDKNVTYSDNTLMEVGIHELAHVVCPEDYHTPLFYTIYRELIEIAKKKKYYDPNIPMEKGYCGYNI